MAVSTISKPDAAAAKKYFENKLAFSTGPVEVWHLMQNGADIHVVDVRAAEDYREEHVPGAVSLPRDRWGSAETVLRKDRTNILYCYSQQCHLAAKAAVQFASKGYSVMEMEGGFKAWKENELEIE